MKTWAHDESVRAVAAGHACRARQHPILRLQTKVGNSAVARYVQRVGDDDQSIFKPWERTKYDDAAYMFVASEDRKKYFYLLSPIERFELATGKQSWRVLKQKLEIRQMRLDENEAKPLGKGYPAGDAFPSASNILLDMRVRGEEDMRKRSGSSG